MALWVALWAAIAGAQGLPVGDTAPHRIACFLPPEASKYPSWPDDDGVDRTYRLELSVCCPMERLGTWSRTGQVAEFTDATGRAGGLYSALCTHRRDAVEGCRASAEEPGRCDTLVTLSHPIYFTAGLDAFGDPTLAPEPGAFAVVVLAVVVLLLDRRRRRRRVVPRAAKP